MPPAQAPANVADAMSMLTGALDHLSAADWPGLGCQAQGEVLAGLRGAQARLTALQAGVLSAFTAATGYEPDGHGSSMQWLIHRTGISRGAARGAIGWQKRLWRHAVIARAMGAGAISESWAKDIALWTDPLPRDERDKADQILLDAAAGGCPLEDLKMLALEIIQRWKSQHPDPDDGNGDGEDEDGFGDRRLRLETTFGGAGKVNGDLTAGCAAALQAIFDAFGKNLGPEDIRNVEQRQHDALAEALYRLIKSGMLPESAGQATLAQVIIPFAALRQEPGASEFESSWIAMHAGQPGWLTGVGAEAGACDAAIAPVVTGTVDWQVVDAMADVWIAAHGIDSARVTPEAKAELRRTLLEMAADAMSGPGGLASYLRGKLLDVPFTAKSLPLDVGEVRGIPDHLRRAVILRDRQCAWPGGCDKPPAACQVHHVVFRSRGGKTRLSGLILLCEFHHQVCVHRWGWQLTLHADGTVEAISPHGEVLRSHGPPTARAG